MRRSGTMDLPLHGGKAPFWLVSRMKDLSKEIFHVLIDEFGATEVIRRLADPFWFQALSCTLAYDWHSSGTTTVVCGVLKSSIDPEEFGIGFSGGKGKVAMKTQSDLEVLGEKLGISSAKIEKNKYASRLAAKVDNAAIQDGYKLYHHSMVVSEGGEWAIIQQGMNPETRYARRYHWLSERVKSFVEEPHEGIIGDKPHKNVLNMVAKESNDCRGVCTDIVKEKPGALRRVYKSIRPLKQRALTEWTEGKNRGKGNIYELPKRVDWGALKRAYEVQPKNYEEVLSIKGIGPATVRGLALISELIYGTQASWQDPVKFSFAFGGKDGVPYPVDKRAMDESVKILERAIGDARIGNKEKIRALKRLRGFINPVL